MYLIPQPKNIEYGESGSHFTLSYGSYVVLEPSCGEKLTAQAKLAVEALKEELGFAPALTRGTGRPGDVILSQSEEMAPQSYRLIVDEKMCVLQAGRPAYGMAARPCCRWLRSAGPCFLPSPLRTSRTSPTEGFTMTLPEDGCQSCPS